MQRHMPMGYKMVNGQIEVNEEQAQIVKAIFTDYIKGKSLKAIAKKLSDKGVLNANMKPNWNHGSVGKILQNVKYQGDEFYPRLIDQATYKKAQDMRAAVEKKLGRSQQFNAMKNQSIFSGKIKCGECGETYKKYIEHAGKPSEKIKWKCRNYIFQNRVLCRNSFFTEDELKSIFTEATNQLIRQKKRLDKIQPDEPPKMNLELRQTDNRIKELEQDGEFSSPELAELIFKRAVLYYEGSKVADQKWNAEKLKSALSDINTLTEFNEELFETIIKQMTVYKETFVKVEFINGITFNISIEYKRKDGKNGSSEKNGSNHTASS
ncbi:recombinase family protein [Anaerosolibacter sp.]|uniref:recombinase family protein n=1 Tax=Anaerosolibacter sp. TaxID=1872527 RepID=UPI0039F04973